MERTSATPVDLHNPDEFRPAKRVKLDAPLDITKDTQQEIMDEDDWDDIYDEPAKSDTTPAAQTIAPACDAPTAIAPSAPHEHQYGVVAKQEESTPNGEAMDGVPAEAIDKGDDLVAPQPQPPPENNDQASLDVMEETTEVEYQPPVSAGDRAESPVMIDAPAQPPVKATEDPEFMEAAAAQKSDQNAEWQYDSSDAESSSDSDSSDSSDSSDDSGSGSEGGYEMLDPATAAKILMSGDGDDEDGDKSKGKNGADNQPRTQNEVKEEVVPKPDVVVTPDMKITFLGTVDRIVDKMILIKGATPGEYQVLEYGSVICNEKREVIGAIADTFGRVQEPLYSVAFTNEKEIQDAGLDFGSKIFYVDSHSTFVFTQPLKNSKGTDASNIHDEEVGEDELEFSDDEQEAEFKRQKKLAKKAGRGGLSRSAFQAGERSFGTPAQDTGSTFVRGSDVPAQSYGGGMSYDDDEPSEIDFYQPLKRPDNLSQLMAMGPSAARPPQPMSDRGRGRGRGDRGRGDRGRGRGDRGRGRGGFDRGNQRGGRRGSNASDASHRGNAQTFQDRNRSHGKGQHQQDNFTRAEPSTSSTAAQQQPPQQYQHPPPSSYQFNGYTFQYGNQQSGYGQQQSQQNPVATVPAGAYVNPAFVQQQAQQQAYAAWYAQQQQQHGQQQWQPQMAAQANAGAQQPQFPANVDLGNILQQLRGPQGQ